MAVDPTGALITVDVLVELGDSLVDKDASVGLNQAPRTDIVVVLIPTVSGGPLRYAAGTPIPTTHLLANHAGVRRGGIANIDGGHG